MHFFLLSYPTYRADSLYIINDSIRLIIESSKAFNEKTNIDWNVILTMIISLLTIIFAYYKLKKENKIKIELLEKEITNQNKTSTKTLIQQNYLLIHQLKINEIAKNKSEMINVLKSCIQKVVYITAKHSSHNNFVKIFPEYYKYLMKIHLELNPIDKVHNELISLIESTILDINNMDIDQIRESNKIIINKTKQIILIENKKINDEILNFNNNEHK